MTLLIKVKFENGLLRPLQPIDWQEDEEHIVAVQDNTSPVIRPSNAPNPEAVAALWEEITAQAVVTGEKENIGSDHDKYLYGKPYGV